MKTDTELKIALAKMLPSEIRWDTSGVLAYATQSRHYGYVVKDTELLHICWLVEETLTNNECNQYNEALVSVVNPTLFKSGFIGWLFHATWQQRAAALCKVKGIEVC